jgi:hypothetical protein
MLSTEGTPSDAELQLLPLGTRCPGGTPELHGPGTAAWLAWIAAALLLFVAARRPGRARGALAAAVVLAVVSFLYHFGGELSPAALGAWLLGMPLVWAVERSAVVAVVLPPVVLAVWFVAFGLGFDVAAVLLGVAVGGLVAVAVPTPGQALALPG